jgi:ABC-type phosphonate transport system ATPase subunit
MSNVENLTKTSASRRAVDDLSFDVHPGPLSGPVVVSVPSIVAQGCGLWLLTRARRTLTA